MKFSKPLEQIVNQRYSVRTYKKNGALTDSDKEEIRAVCALNSGPFPAKIVFKIIENDMVQSGAKLGTYGMIRGARVFIGGAVEDTDWGTQALGYHFEKLILYLTQMGLGTCWLGGTFNKGAFEKMMKTPEGMIFPAVSPIGYADKKRLAETLVRGFIRADTRKPWGALFFDGDFSTPLEQATAGAYAFPLEMVRLGPSASNKQPCRIVRLGEWYHFFEQKTPGYGSAFSFDMQSIDMGIAACHFHLACIEKGIDGAFDLSADPQLVLPDNTVYQFSWHCV